MVYNKGMKTSQHKGGGVDAIRQMGAILFVGAHPDDETFCCGGILAVAARNGQRVICVTATHGEKGVQDETRWPASDIAAIRERELGAALVELGVAEHRWLSYKDGECAQAGEDDAAHAIAAIIEHNHVDSVVTFGPDGLTGHSDHRAMSRWVDGAVHISTRKPHVFHIAQPRETYEQALKAADKTLNMFFNVKRPQLVEAPHAAVYLHLDSDAVVRKYLAFKVMPSQMERILAVIPPEQFGTAFGVEALVDATGERT